MTPFKAICIWCYTIFGSALIIAMAIILINNPVKELSELQIASGPITKVKHTNRHGYKTHLSIAGETDLFHTFLKREKRSLVVVGKNATVWYSETLTNYKKIEQIKLNDALLFEYSYDYHKSIQYKQIAILLSILLGFIYIYRHLIIKIMKSKT
jgi:hypothetical protein